MKNMRESLSVRDNPSRLIGRSDIFESSQFSPHDGETAK